MIQEFRNLEIHRAADSGNTGTQSATSAKVELGIVGGMDGRCGDRFLRVASMVNEQVEAIKKLGYKAYELGFSIDSCPYSIGNCWSLANHGK